MRQRLFAEDMLAGFRGRNGDLGMGVVGRVDVDDIDLGIGNDLPPVGRDMAPAELLGRGGHALFVAAANGVKHRLGGNGKKFVDLAPRVRMGLAHELVADHSDF